MIRPRIAHRIPAMMMTSQKLMCVPGAVSGTGENRWKLNVQLNGYAISQPAV